MNDMKKYETVPEGMDPKEYAEQQGGIHYSCVPFGPFVMRLTTPTEVVDFLKVEGKKLEDLSVKTKLAGHLDKEHQYPEEIKLKFVDMMGNVFSGYRNAHIHYHGIQKMIDERGDDIKNFEPQMYLENLWVNYMREGEFNPPHVHSGDLSFVIYLGVPDMKEEIDAHIANSPPPGSIQFMNELGGNEETWKVTQQTFNPVEGEMFIFPASLHHSVFPYKTPGTRISVSGNIHYTNKDKWPKYFF